MFRGHVTYFYYGLPIKWLKVAKKSAKYSLFEKFNLRIAQEQYTIYMLLGKNVKNACVSKESLKIPLNVFSHRLLKSLFFNLWSSKSRAQCAKYFSFPFRREQNLLRGGGVITKSIKPPQKYNKTITPPLLSGSTIIFFMSTLIY